MVASYQNKDEIASLLGAADREINTRQPVFRTVVVAWTIAAVAGVAAVSSVLLSRSKEPVVGFFDETKMEMLGSSHDHLRRHDHDCHHHHQPGKLCSDFFGKVFDEQGMVVFSGESGDLDLMVDSGTFITIPSADDETTADFYGLVENMPSSSGGGPYLEYGTIHLLEGQTHNHTVHCHAESEGNAYFGQLWEQEKDVLLFNTLDGKSWIMSGTKDLSAGAVRANLVFVPSDGKKDCISRVKNMVGAFAEVNVSLPEDILRDVCH